jgi:hypothetical protein
LTFSHAQDTVTELATKLGVQIKQDWASVMLMSERGKDQNNRRTRSWSARTTISTQLDEHRYQFSISNLQPQSRRQYPTLPLRYLPFKILETWPLSSQLLMLLDDPWRSTPDQEHHRNLSASGSAKDSLTQLSNRLKLENRTRRHVLYHLPE